MANFEFYAKLADQIGEEFTPSKLDVIEAAAYGYSNKSIANEYSLSIKTVEKAFAAIIKKFEADNKLYSSRIRMISSLLANNFISYHVAEPPKKLESLSSDLNHTLILSALGLSNHAMAMILGVTNKTIEKRLGQLFDLFGIETKNHDVENPRVLLLINALIRENISQEQLKKLYKETAAERLERIAKEPEMFLQHLDSKNYVIG